MTTRPSSTDSFLTKLHHRYATATAGRALAAELQALLAAWPAESDTIPPAPKRLPACDHLDAALVAGRSGPEAGLAEALSALSPASSGPTATPPAPASPIYPPPSPSARSSDRAVSGRATSCAWG